MNEYHVEQKLLDLKEVNLKDIVFQTCDMRVVTFVSIVSFSCQRGKKGIMSDMKLTREKNLTQLPSFA